MPTPRPHFRELDRDECLVFIAQRNVGRLALSHKDRVDIVPIHYVHHEGWLYGRTAAGNKLEMVVHNRWVAFEVDDVHGLFAWESVVIKGGLYLLRKEGSDHERSIYERGVELVRQFVPEAMTPEDPIPERALLFRIHIDEITGRAATPG
jgi:nitroimidazol reductase NimA-like FMN-containing flavoprotein (pyridoxamine 5'-phosphate oxidase superfamily)